MTDSERIGHILRAIGHEIQAERVTFMAASIAYNAFLSLLPLALLLLAAVTTVGSESLEATLLSLANSAMTPEAGDVLVRELERSSTEVSVLGLVVLLWGALRIFRSLDAAFSDIYETEARNTFANQLVDGLVVLVSVAAVLAVALVVLTGLPSDGAGSWVLRRMALLGGVSLALFPMFYRFPDVPDITASEILPGVVVTAIGLVTFQSLFELYLVYSSPAAKSSLLAAVIVLMTWLYFNALIVLVGAAVNAVLSNRSEDVRIDPVIGGLAPAARESDQPHAVVFESLVERLGDADTWELRIDGEPVDLPLPTAVRVAGAGTAGLDLRWSHAQDDRVAPGRPSNQS